MRHAARAGLFILVQPRQGGQRAVRADAGEKRVRVAWRTRLPAVVGEHGPATVAMAAEWILGREPSRTELVAAHRAARQLVEAGHLAGGRTWAPDATGRKILTACIGAPGASLPAGTTHGAIARSLGVSRSKVDRIARRHAAEVADGSNRHSAGLTHRQHLRPRFVDSVVRGFLRLRPAERAAAAEAINAAMNGDGSGVRSGGE